MSKAYIKGQDYPKKRTEIKLALKDFSFKGNWIDKQPIAILQIQTTADGGTLAKGGLYEQGLVVGESLTIVIED